MPEVPTRPLTCRKRDLGAGMVGPAVPLAVWVQDTLPAYFSVFLQEGSGSGLPTTVETGVGKQRHNVRLT